MWGQSSNQYELQQRYFAELARRQQYLYNLASQQQQTLFSVPPQPQAAKRVVAWNRKTAKSGRVLNEALVALGYTGPVIIWGRYNNKRRALEKMKEAGVPIPDLTYEWPDYPCVGRPDFHQKGKRMYRSPDEVKTKKKRFQPTHFLRWVEATREYRVHVVYDKAIKYSEKKPIGNYETGAKFYYPWDLDWRQLEKLGVTARNAVKALDFDFGAVDIVEDADGNLYVLEVNTAPRLTDSVSDTLDRYARAFYEAHRV